MRVLLINPPLHSLYYAADIIFPPMSLMCVGAALEKGGHEVFIKDLTIDSSPIDYTHTDIVGLTCTTSQFNTALSLAEEAHEAGKPVFMGGVHATFDAESAICSGGALSPPVVDYVVGGEGEMTALELCEGLEAAGKDFNPEKVAGLSWFDKDSKRVIHNPERPAIPDIDSLPYPARHLLDLPTYKTRLRKNKSGTTILTSRGCPFKCIYCVVPNTNGALYRCRSAKSVVDEIESLMTKYGFEDFLFVDDIFTINTRRTNAICDEIIKRDLDIAWWCQSRADTLVKNEKMVEKMAKSGCKMVFIGFETPNERILQTYGKRSSADIGTDAVKLLAQYGIQTMGSFMMGEISETREEIQNTIDYSRELNIEYAQFSILTPFLGTKLYEQVKERILTYDWDKYDGAHAVLKLDNLLPQEIEGLLEKAYKQFYLRPKWLVKNLIGLNPKQVWALLKCF